MSVAEIFDTMAYGPAPEDATFVRDWLGKQDDPIGLFINGTWTKASESNPIDAGNPATGERLARFSAAGKTDVDGAVGAAKAAHQSWSSLAPFERAKYLYALARQIQKSSRFLAVLESLDNGKPIRESRDVDIPLAARHFYYHAGWAHLVAQEFPRYQSLGVVGQIIPWNFPFLMLAWKIAPALAAGNTVVLKPAEQTSLTALYFATLCQEAQLPEGVFNIVTGDGETGRHLVDHPDIAKIAFTGSTSVGKYIRTQTAGSEKTLTLELGGKSPFIVFDDADLDGAVEGMVDSIWFNQGEVCCAGSRLLVEESVAEAFITKIKRRLETLRLGDPLDKSVDMGAIVSEAQIERIRAFVNRAQTEGATVWQPDNPAPTSGYYFPPTLLLDVAPSFEAVCEEIFGPVLSVMTFRTLPEAVTLANNTRYGLAASVWSETANRALDVASRLQCGVVWINTANAFDAACAFGGYRESGFGREGGKAGMLEYMAPKDEWLSAATPEAVSNSGPASSRSLSDQIDRTAKNYVGGKQSRPDGGRTRHVTDANGSVIGRVSESNRKDVRNAVEAARQAAGWASATAFNRSQILYFLAENLGYRESEFVDRLKSSTGITKKAAQQEVKASLSRLFTYGAWADKHDGVTHTPPQRNTVLSVNEPVGVIGILCPDEHPLLSFVSLFAPALAMGNRCVIVPSERYPLVATDFYQIWETSDVPSGVLNLLTGDRDSLAKTLSEHNDVDAVWYFGSSAGSKMVQENSVGNLKRTWVNLGRTRDWASPNAGEGETFLRRATQVKTIWLPFGD